jgi:hypothetical protein
VTVFIAVEVDVDERILRAITTSNLFVLAIE